MQIVGTAVPSGQGPAYSQSFWSRSLECGVLLSELKVISFLLEMRFSKRETLPRCEHVFKSNRDTLQLHLRFDPARKAAISKPSSGFWYPTRLASHSVAARTSTLNARITTSMGLKD